MNCRPFGITTLQRSQFLPKIGGSTTRDDFISKYMMITHIVNNNSILQVLYIY
jgi:hypothetical protein